MNLKIILQDLMDIEDFQTFSLKIFSTDTTDLVSACKAYFKKGRIFIVGDLIELFPADKETAKNGKYDISVNDLPKFFSAKIPIKRYDYDILDYVYINRCQVLSDLKISITKGIDFEGELEIFNMPDGIYFSLYSRDGKKIK